MSTFDETMNPDGELSQPDQVIDVGGDSIAPPEEPVPAAPDGVPVDPDLTPDEPGPSAPDEPTPSLPEESASLGGEVGSGDARDVPNPAL